MKRLLVFALFACLLFCGCKADTPTSADPAEEPTQEQTQTPAENTPETEAAPEEPDQTSSETVTVYLLDQSFLYDSGHTEYKYDQACNIDSYTVFTLENEPMYTAYFEEKDNNGKNCTKLNNHKEHILKSIRGIKCCKFINKNHMPRAAYRQPLGYTFNNSD